MDTEAAVRAAPLEPALIGRDAQLSRLRDRVMEAAVFGRGSVVLVAGERGAGKTRLVAEVEREAAIWGGMFLPGSLPGEPLSSLRLLELSQQRPAVLCLEDLHQADRTSLQLLCQLAGRNAALPLMIVGTYRPERAAANGVNFREAVWELCLYPHFEHLRLGRLSLAQTRVVLYSCFSRSAFSEDLVERLYRQTGGVPLFIVQYLEQLRQDRILYQDRGVWVNRPVGEEQVPVAARAALLQQLQGLPEEQRAVLCCAAAQGEFFAGAPVARALGRPLIGLLRELGRLERATHLVCRCARGFRFAHPLLVELCREYRHGDEGSADRSAVRDLQDHRVDRARGHGQGVPGLGRGPAAGDRPEGAAPRPGG
jgi:hypothetical protein